ncbi:YbaB/EbfC family nucleoid-associated protein [Nocardia stercoris]|uniref:YbaB/EbfC family DNA-binding protein n=1 Tax=Nocardia stercoris TaxID=2483361 RepID=A0A3M2LKX7_9NOCA|nr:YbaB/EbfC family nucleoid-associated protein [Nocardia stercoris]RMI35478.1 hypothetical protein EBN03_04270 [Nocardia stercoris]
MMEIDFGSLLADLDHKESEAAAAGARIATLTATVRSPDGVVEVTVNAAGTPTALVLSPNSFRTISADELSRSIATAARAAARQVLADLARSTGSTRDLVRELAGSPPTEAPTTPATTRPTTAAKSADGTVRVTVDAMGVLETVQIARSAFSRNTPEQLARSILTTATRALRGDFDARLTKAAAAPELLSAALEAMVEVPDEHASEIESHPEAADRATTTPTDPAVRVRAETRTGSSEHTATQRSVGIASAARRRLRQRVVGPSDWLEDEERYRDERRGSWLE